MFIELFYLLRAEGVPAGGREFLLLLEGLSKGLVSTVDELYHLGRAILCRTEADFDAWDIAFSTAFREAALDPEVRKRLEEWLESARERIGDELVDPPFETDAELWKAFLERLQEQEGRHDGGSRWIGTGGTSPFGHSGRASRGIRVGGPGGNRGAIQVADARQWENYRTDTALKTRDFKVALRTLRRLQREGRWELDLDETIETTCRNAGEIELVERRERENQVHLVLLMDAGGSMAPHAQRVEALFTAAEDVGSFKSFQAYFFHNCVYHWLWTDFEAGERVPSADVLAGLTSRHRLVFVGDASMAPYELFSASGWGHADAQRHSGIEWLRRFRRRSPASVWLNPDPETWWDHPTVSAIGKLFPMFELTLEGLRDGIGRLRAPI
jgi:hypothetical protein